MHPCAAAQKPAENTSSRAWAEVDTGAIVGNARSIRAWLRRPETRIMAVVKADAYGHGATQVARAVHASMADAWFGVATVAEAAEVRAALPDARICVLEPWIESESEDLVDCRATPVVSDPASVAALQTAASRRSIRLPVHIELDTGMGRCGVRPCELAALTDAVLQSPALRLEGLLTHFPDAEGDPRQVYEQIAMLRRAANAVRKRSGGPLLLHAANSAGLILHPEAALDMVRPGMALYGLLPVVPSGAPVPAVEPALVLKARILLVRDLPRGHRISYGGTSTLARPSRVAAIGIGYGDGYPRALSNRAHAIVRGFPAPILGRVCMDVTMLDVTDVPGASVGDVATLIGAEGGRSIRADELARSIGAAEHEITTCLTRRIPRVYIGMC